MNRLTKSVMKQDNEPLRDKAGLAGFAALCVCGLKSLDGGIVCFVCHLFDYVWLISK